MHFFRVLSIDSSRPPPPFSFQKKKKSKKNEQTVTFISNSKILECEIWKIQNKYQNMASNRNALSHTNPAIEKHRLYLFIWVFTISADISYVSWHCAHKHTLPIIINTTILCDPLVLYYFNLHKKSSWVNFKLGDFFKKKSARTKEKTEHLKEKAF